MIVLKKQLESNYEDIIDVYEYVCNFLDENNLVKNKYNLLRELVYRNDLGEMLISNDFYLPHIKTSEVDKLTIINVVGYKDFKILFILVPEFNFDKYKDKVIKIILNLDKKDFLESMGSDELSFKQYLNNVINNI